MGVIAEGILRGCQGLFTPVSLGYPLSVFNKNSTLKRVHIRILAHTGPRELDGHPLGGCGSGFGLVPGYTTLPVRVRANT